MIRKRNTYTPTRFPTMLRSHWNFVPPRYTLHDNSSSVGKECNIYTVSSNLLHMKFSSVRVLPLSLRSRHLGLFLKILLPAYLLSKNVRALWTIMNKLIYLLLTQHLFLWMAAETLPPRQNSLHPRWMITSRPDIFYSASLGNGKHVQALWSFSGIVRTSLLYLILRKSYPINSTAAESRAFVYPMARYLHIYIYIW